MQVKTGVDIVKVGRIEKLLKKPSFLKLAFTEKELKNKKPEHIAGIFAAKEAFFKATQIKINHLSEIEISYSKDGKPTIVYNAQNIKFSISSLDCSISHDGDYAIAVITVLVA